MAGLLGLGLVVNASLVALKARNMRQAQGILQHGLGATRGVVAGQPVSFPTVSINIDLAGVAEGVWVMNLHITVNGQVVASGVRATLEDSDIAQDVRASDADASGNISWGSLNGYNNFPEVRHKYIIHAWYRVGGVDVLTGLWPIWLGWTDYCTQDAAGVTHCYPGA